MTAPTCEASNVDLSALMRDLDVARERQRVAEREYGMAKLRVHSAIRSGRIVGAVAS